MLSVRRGDSTGTSSKSSVFMLCHSWVLPTMSPMIAPNIVLYISKLTLLILGCARHSIQGELDALLSLALKFQSKSLLLQFLIFRLVEAEEKGFFLL